MSAGLNRNRLPRPRRRRLIEFGLLCLLATTVALVGWHYLLSRTSSKPASTKSKLAWAPPPCGIGGFPCHDITLTNTGTHQTPSLDPDVDYRIHLPTSGPLVGGITILSGHNVQIIGGEIDMTYPCSNDASDCMGIYIAKHSAGAMFVEGVWIHNPSTIPSTCPTRATSTSQPCSTGDGIDVNTANTGSINVNTITLENIRIDGISGCSGYGDHADVFQPYQAPDDTIQIDRTTGLTNCQGFTVEPNLAYSAWHTFPSSITIENVNLVDTNNPYTGFRNRYLWWLTGGSNGCGSGPIALSYVYTSEADGTMTTNSAWPDTDRPAVCMSKWSGSTLSFPNTRVTGSITEGTPSGGDFVPLGAVGINYTSPGYR